MDNLIRKNWQYYVLSFSNRVIIINYNSLSPNTFHQGKNKMISIIRDHKYLTKEEVVMFNAHWILSPRTLQQIRHSRLLIFVWFYCLSEEFDIARTYKKTRKWPKLLTLSEPYSSKGTLLCLHRSTCCKTIIKYLRH